MSPPLLKITLASLLLILSGCASIPLTTMPVECEAVKIDAQSINHQPNNFGAWLSSPQGILHIGDWLMLSWQTQQDAYINLFYISSSGKTAQLVRNQAQQKQQISVFPSPQQRNGLRLNLPTGIERYLLIASKKPLASMTEKSAINQDIQTFDFTGDVLLRKIHAITSKLNPHDWASSDLQLPLCQPKKQSN
jgi:hypothetical protein